MLSLLIFSETSLSFLMNDIRFRPRILIDVSHIDMSSSVLGYNISMPFMIAPTASHKMAHPEGELPSARAAATEGTIMTLSSWSSYSIDKESTRLDLVYKDRNLVQQVIRRAEKASYKAIVLLMLHGLGAEKLMSRTGGNNEGSPSYGSLLILSSQMKCEAFIHRSICA
ncbi:unnamed protein product [Urochloa humidicola]